MSRRRPAASGHKTVVRRDNGTLPVGSQFVAVDVQCRRCGKRLARVERYTFAGADDELWIEPVRGVGYAEDDFHGPGGKLAWYCPCGATPQARRDKLEAGLAELWRPERHTVVTLPL